MGDRIAGSSSLHKESWKLSWRPLAKEGWGWWVGETGRAQRKKGEEAEDAGLSPVKINTDVDVKVYRAGRLS